MPSEKNYDGKPDVEELNKAKFDKLDKLRGGLNEKSNQFEPLVKKGVSSADDFCGNSVTELHDKIAIIIRANTLPNDFGFSTLKEEDILFIAKEIEELVNTENKGIDHAIKTLRDQVKNNEA